MCDDNIYLMKRIKEMSASEGESSTPKQKANEYEKNRLIEDHEWEELWTAKKEYL